MQRQPLSRKQTKGAPAGKTKRPRSNSAPAVLNRTALQPRSGDTVASPTDGVVSNDGPQASGVPGQRADVGRSSSGPVGANRTPVTRPAQTSVVAGPVQRRAAPVIAPVAHVDLKSIFPGLKSETIFLDQPFKSVQAAQSIDSFVRVHGGNLEMSVAFREGLDLLAQITGGKGPIYEALVADLRALQTGTAHAKLTHLQSFIDYQVYKVGEHYRTHDEQKWTHDIAVDVMAKVPQVKQLHDQIVAEPLQTLARAIKERDKPTIQRITGSDKLIDDAALDRAQQDSQGLELKRLQQAVATRAAAPLLKAIEDEVAKHYMCRMRYTQPIASLVARDTPKFIQERLRLEQASQNIYFFETSNGVTIAYDSTIFTAETARETLGGVIADKKVIEFTPFDPAKFMIARIRVPVMSEPITLHLALEGHDPLDVMIGKYPEEMGYQMSPEPAGVFRRSLNSQRVTEIQGADDQGRPVTFQMKGAGVPAYGFDLANAGNDEFGTYTGSEFFKLNAEMGSIGLRSFAAMAFGADRIAPQTIGMALAADKAHAYSKEKRNGAVSFRADYSLGVRLENVLSANEQEPDATVQAMREKQGLKADEMAKHKAQMLHTMARHLAITHLFGMHYDDSSMKDLADVGLAGEFSDSGTLRNLDVKAPAPLEDSTFVSQGVKTMLGHDASKRFPELYADEMVGLLEELASSSQHMLLKELTRKLQAELTEPVDRLHFLRQLAATLGGPSSMPTLVQQAFYTEGLAGYASVLAASLLEKLNHLDEFKAERIASNPAEAHATYTRFRFESPEQLETALDGTKKALRDEVSNLVAAMGSVELLPQQKTDLMKSLEQLQHKAERLAYPNIKRSDDDAQIDDESLDDFILRVNGALANAKSKLRPEEYITLSSQHDKLKQAMTQLNRIRQGVSNVRNGLQAAANADKRIATKTPREGAQPGVMVPKQQGPNPALGRSAIFSQINQRPQLRSVKAPVTPPPTGKDAKPDQTDSEEN